MSKHRKHWSESDKKTILQHYQEHGAVSTSRQFEVSTSMIYRWAAACSPAAVKEAESVISSKEYHRLVRENQALKELVAEKVGWSCLGGHFTFESLTKQFDNIGFQNQSEIGSLSPNVTDARYNTRQYS